MSHGWMVKSGHGGSLVEALLKLNVVAIRWDDIASGLNGLTKKEIADRAQKTSSNYHRSAVANAAAMLFGWGIFS